MDRDCSICRKYICIFTILLFVSLLSIASCLWADSRYSKAEEIVDNSRYSLQKFLHHTDYNEFRKMLKRAKAILIVPDLFKAGFIASYESGDGILLVRQGQEENSSWSAPVFYSITSGSVGLQLGAQSMEIVFLIMSNAGLESILSNSVKIGADVSVTIGLIGGGLEASTDIDMSADIFAFSKSKGFFGGAGIKGSWVEANTELNRSFYDADANPKKIITQQSYKSMRTDRLLDTLENFRQ